MPRIHRTLAPLSCAVLLVLLGCATTGGSPADLTDRQTALDRMQGEWRSTDDPLSVIEISADRMISVYDGEELAVGTIEWVDRCPESVGDGLSFTVGNDEDGVLCYHLLRLDDDRLEYSYSARGNTLSYERVE